MKQVFLKLMFVISVLVMCSCDMDKLFIEAPTIEPEINVSVETTYSHTENGVNFKFTFEEIPHKAGDVLKLLLDSDNEEKPYVKMMVNGKEVIYTSKLPTEGVYTTNVAGQYSILFHVYDGQEILQFTIQTYVDVE